jgi:hypothetical protein
VVTKLYLEKVPKLGRDPCLLAWELLRQYRARVRQGGKEDGNSVRTVGVLPCGGIGGEAVGAAAGGGCGRLEVGGDGAEAAAGCVHGGGGGGQGRWGKPELPSRGEMGMCIAWENRGERRWSV